MSRKSSLVSHNLNDAQDFRKETDTDSKEPEE
jgi:hypothetical protein